MAPKKPTKLNIKKDLLARLAERQVSDQHYIDMVNDYCSLWEIKNLLIKDIKKRGVSVYWANYNKDGDLVQEGWKKNESITELTKTNSQMLKILKELGIEPVNPEPEPETLEM